MSTTSAEIRSLATQARDSHLTARLLHLADDVAQLATDLNTVTAINHSLHTSAQAVLDENTDLRAKLEEAHEATRQAHVVAGRLMTSYRIAKEQGYEHDHGEDDGHPECPACWTETIANALGVDQ